MGKSKLKKAADKEFSKLSKKEQRRINGLKRIPVAGPGYRFDAKTPPRKKTWAATEERPARWI